MRNIGRGTEREEGIEGGGGGGRGIGTKMLVISGWGGKWDSLNRSGPSFAFIAFREMERTETKPNQQKRN